ncbi:hypothetical protein [Nocardia flavorosea]|uniref:Uncharacterized protein n=1 Tax=Nocardia flavorosea TaxID=53429 RepID=A0A846YFF5_9NOCA|nr:hypothetical protein [Nocardia flavorosea]NKY57647.1 hypothetical protein [Nocardia flavorosea]
MTGGSADRTGTVSFAAVAARAGDLGYELVRGQDIPAGWMLLDADDGAHLHSAATLTEIARYLDA